VSQRRPNGGKSAFTLVELLVVIGIIAILVAILLPSLNAARRQAATVKCMSALRQCGNAWRMYADDNRGYACPIRVGGPGESTGQGKPYSVDGILYGSGSFIAGVQTDEAAWWMNFLAKYVTKTRGGAGDMTVTQNQLARATVLWGCPAWEGYPETRQQQINQGSVLEHHYTGYSLNYYPTYSPTNPGPGLPYPLDIERLQIILKDNVATVDTTVCTWWKITRYTNAASRAIMGDCYAISLESLDPPNNGTFPGQPKLAVTGTGLFGLHPNLINGTTFDVYRHGKYPPLIGNSYQATGGKVSYNILFCDGHVANSTDRADAYRVIRMRYPG